MSGTRAEPKPAPCPDCGHMLSDRRPHAPIARCLCRCHDLADRALEMVERLKGELVEYQRIGTVEELRKGKEDGHKERDKLQALNAQLVEAIRGSLDVIDEDTASEILKEALAANEDSGKMGELLESLREMRRVRDDRHGADWKDWVALAADDVCDKAEAAGVI